MLIQVISDQSSQVNCAVSTYDHYSTSASGIAKRIHSFAFLIISLALISGADATYSDCMKYCVDNTENGSLAQLTCFTGCAIGWGILRMIGH